MAFLLDAFKEVIGSIKPWFRWNGAIPIPSGWWICDGSTVSDVTSPFNGMAVPDLRTKFVQGHPTLTNLNFGGDTTYQPPPGGTPVTGGQATVDLSHTHPAGSHTHPVGSHQHTIGGDGNHNHSVGSHSHGISNDNANHNHGNPDTSEVGGLGQGGTNMTQISGTYGGGSPATGLLANFTLGGGNSYSHHHNVGTTNASNASHSHGGNTNSSGGGGTDSQGSHSHGGQTGSTTATTGASAGTTGAETPVLGTTPTVPPFIGLVYIIRIKT